MPPRPPIGSPFLSALKGETKTYAKILENGHENQDPAFLDNRLFSYTLKYVAGIEFTPLFLDDQVALLRPACERLFDMLDKVEIMRIDGRLTPNGLVVIELSPDLDLRPDGEAAISFTAQEGSYPLFLRRLLINSLERAGRQTPMHDER